MNLNLASISTKQNNPAELFSDKVLGVPGSDNWGRSTGSPLVFGLASDYQHSELGYYLDLAKLSRLNSELQDLPIGSQYTYVNPQDVVNNITGLNSNTQFRITTRSPIQVGAVVNDIDPANPIFTVNTSTWGGVLLPNISLDIHIISLTTGNSPYNFFAQTNLNGEYNNQFPGIIADNYVAIIYAHSLDNWGLAWGEIKGLSNSILSSSISSLLLNNPQQNTNSVLEYTTNTTVVSGLRATTCYTNATSNLIVNSTVISNSSGIINQELFGVGSSGPLIQIYSMSNGTTDFYRVVSLPLIFDNTAYNSPSSAYYDTNQYLVYQTSGFSNVDLSTIYSYTTMVLTDRGPILFTIDLSTS